MIWLHLNHSGNLAKVLYPWLKFPGGSLPKSYLVGWKHVWGRYNLSQLSSLANPPYPPVRSPLYVPSLISSHAARPPAILGDFTPSTEKMPSRELTHPTLGKGKLVSKMPWEKDMLVPTEVDLQQSLLHHHHHHQSGWWLQLRDKSTIVLIYILYPIRSMGLAYLPTWMVDFYGTCRSGDTKFETWETENTMEFVGMQHL